MNQRGSNVRGPIVMNAHEMQKKIKRKSKWASAMIIISFSYCSHRIRACAYIMQISLVCIYTLAPRQLPFSYKDLKGRERRRARVNWLSAEEVAVNFWTWERKKNIVVTYSKLNNTLKNITARRIHYVIFTTGYRGDNKNNCATSGNRKHQKHQNRFILVAV